VFEAFRNWLSWRIPGARAQAKDISTQALKFTSEFALLVHTYPVEFVDAALLPASKEAMKFAFRYVWAISEPDMRMMAEVIYPHLSRFQDGVGVVPIAPELPRDTNSATSDEVSPSYLAWVEKVEAEMDELLADIQDWKQNPPPPI
jgi:hypothetical protein